MVQAQKQQKANEISVKELRRTFPEVREQLLEGQKFTITYRNTPLAILKPAPTKKRGKTKEEKIQEDLEQIERYAGTLDLGEETIDLSAEEMDKMADEQYETEMLS